ncbi:histone PARylation factor 1 [Choristoneura fumiferana]|uniref:histone PARylation factor 1 n=1 Tax=Choristoneura fumiferana TaxID=7141 RepID=UPI003D156E69
MSEEWQAYLSDPRTICKYGEKCYQSNPDHHTKYKHPPVNSKRKAEAVKHPAKRFSPYSKKENTANRFKNKAKETEPVNKDVDADAEKPTITEKHDLANESPTTSNQQNTVYNSFVDIIKQLPKDLPYHNSTSDQEIYKELFLVEMPPDFFKFYECLKEDTKDVDKTLAGVNLQLIGPYDLLTGKLPVLDNKDLYLIHWRFYYDPPEFQAVLKSKDKTEFHIGYYRDDPKSPPVFMARADSSKGCHLSPYATNIFSAVYSYLEHQKKSPFTAMAYKKMMEKVKSWAEKHNYSVEEYNAKRRTNLCITKTLHGAGIMVPYDKKTQLGYRKLVESDANIKKLFTRLEEAKSEVEKDKVLSELQPVITYANIAVDECDFGTGLEVGIDMFCSGLKELESSTLNSLCSVYSLLNRAEFGSIIQAHLRCRRKGPDMSVLSIGNK